MKKHLLRTAACALILGGLAACQSDDALTITTPDQLAQEVAKRFDFNSYYSLPLSLKFSPFENVYLYEVDPASNPDAQPFFSAVTNISGQVDVDLPFPGHLIGHTVYAKGKSATLKGTLTEKGITFVSTSRAITITGIDALCRSLTEVTDQYLRPGVNNTNRVAHQMKHIDITPKTVTVGEGDDAHEVDEGTEVMVAMIDHGDVYPNQIYYYYYNTSKTLQGDFKTPGAFVEKFLTDRFRLFPSTDTYPDPGTYEDYGWNTDAKIGKTVQLKYYGSDYAYETGVDNFPVGYSIGFILVTKENDSDNMWMKLTTGGCYKLKEKGVDKVKDATTWGSIQGGVEKYAAAMDIGGMLNSDSNLSLDTNVTGTYETLKGYNNWVYTFEDNTAGDYDMNDAKFLAVIKGNIEEGAPKIGDKFLKLKGYYCFEDLYPDQSGGDYDLNDVIVRYEYNFSIGKIPSPAGEADGVICFDYTIEPIWDGATYVNDFHLSYSNPAKWTIPTATGNRKEGHTEVYTDHRAKLQLKEQTEGEQGIFKGWANATFSGDVQVFDTTESDGDEFAEALIFATLSHILPSTSTTIEGDETVEYITGINPYIYCQDTGEEVHLTKFPKPGTNGSTSLLDYYLTDVTTGGEKMKYCPFAIDIPNCDGTKFTPTPESTPIYVAFPKFVQWVESEGKEYTDWYDTTPMGAEEE